MFTLRAMGYQITNVQPGASMWATTTMAGHAVVRCVESLSRRSTAPNPVLAIVSARDTLGGSLVRIRVVGWRAGETPQLVPGTLTINPNGPCVSTGSLERELFSVLGELARRAAPSN